MQTATKPSTQKPKRRDTSRVLCKQAAVYGKPIKRRKARFPSGKARKRSFSASPKDHQKKKTGELFCETCEKIYISDNLNVFSFRNR